MLGGLSPHRLCWRNTLLASLIAGAVGILAAAITELDSETLPLQIVPGAGGARSRALYVVRRSPAPPGSAWGSWSR